MAEADADDLLGLMDAMDGDGPAVERSSMALPAVSDDPNKPPKPLEQMSLAEQLAWQATRLKPKGSTAAPKAETNEAETDPDKPPKPLE